MGRYYTGDIEGKFWFAVQSSNDADFFGKIGQYPTSYLEYYFKKEDLPKINKGITKCENALKDYKEKLDNFFNKKDSYNDKEIEKKFNISNKTTRTKLKWYARLQLGEKIKECIEKQGYCQFEAEL